MIQSNQLRLGNLVEYDERIFKIRSLGVLGGDLETEVEIYVEINYDKIKPIPITEEWLSELGFISYENVLGFYIDDLVVSEDFYSKGICSIYARDYEDKWVFIAEFKYIHQLQNLYFAIRGEELIINGLDSLKKSEN